MELVPLTKDHFDEVARIYTEGIATGNATFETKAPDWDTWNKGHLAHCRIVALVDNKVAGWAALSPVSGRCVYGGVAEVSVYIGKEFRGKGVGKALLVELIAQSEQNGLWTLQSGIFPENTASISLHDQCGFRRIGYREKVGQLGGTWRDTIQFERRSKVVGV
jgi:L-amino acid N-acyltransferase YncA